MTASTLPFELIEEMRCVLDECINSDLKEVALTFGVSTLRLEAVETLNDLEALREHNPKYFKVTYSGRVLYGQLTGERPEEPRKLGFDTQRGDAGS